MKGRCQAEEKPHRKDPVVSRGGHDEGLRSAWVHISLWSTWCHQVVPSSGSLLDTLVPVPAVLLSPCFLVNDFPPSSLEFVSKPLRGAGGPVSKEASLATYACAPCSFTGISGQTLRCLFGCV